MEQEEQEMPVINPSDCRRWKRDGEWANRDAIRLIPESEVNTKICVAFVSGVIGGILLTGATLVVVDLISKML